MAVTRETLRLIGQIRILIADTVDATTDDLVRSWAYAWTLIAKDWEVAVAELQAIRGDGKWPSRTQIIKAERTQAALEATYASLSNLSDQAGIRILSGLSDVVQAAQGHLDVIASQVPKVEQADFRASLIRADSRQISAIVNRTQDRVTKTVFPLPGDSYNTIRRTLIRGVALGQNPRVAARNMVRDVQLGYNQALTRAMVVARTEIQDAHRAGALAIRTSNADVLGGWRWLAQLDSRTCPSCWAMDGSLHRADEAGPDDHQQGRCSALPVTKPWKELGFDDIAEPPSIIPDAETTFQALPDADQLKIMGAGRLELLKSGDIAWSDLSTRQTNSGWRDSHVVTPLKSLSSSS